MVFHIYQPRTSSFSVGYECFEDEAGTWRLRIWDEDGDYFYFFRVLMCPEIDLVYITHLFAFAFHSFDDIEDAHDPWALDDFAFSVLHEIFPGFSVVRPFSQAHFRTQVAVYTNQRRRASSALIPLVPEDVAFLISDQSLPEWTRYEFTEVNMETALMAPRSNYRAILATHFYVV
jgi:hypothetical protein